MESTAQHFMADHRECDELWSEVEAAVQKKDDAAAKSAWEVFERRMRRHFAMEEEVLFPDLEAVTGMPPFAGPTAVMRMEHEQMRGVLDQMAGEAAKGNFVSLADHGDTLLMLIQQHNVKEEGILYPMADQALPWPDLEGRLSKY